MKITINKITCLLYENAKGEWYVANYHTRELITQFPCCSKLEAIQRADKLIHLMAMFAEVSK